MRVCAQWDLLATVLLSNGGIHVLRSSLYVVGFMYSCTHNFWYYHGTAVHSTAGALVTTTRRIVVPGYHAQSTYQPVGSTAVQHHGPCSCSCVVMVQLKPQGLTLILRTLPCSCPPPSVRSAAILSREEIRRYRYHAYGTYTNTLQHNCEVESRV